MPLNSLLRPLIVALTLLGGAAQTAAIAGEPVRLGPNLQYDIAQFRPDLCETPNAGRFWMQVGDVTLAAPVDRLKTILPNKGEATKQLERSGNDASAPFLASNLTTTTGCANDPFPIFLATLPTEKYPLLQGFRVLDASDSPVASIENLRQNFARFRAHQGCKTGGGWRVCQLTDRAGKAVLMYLPDVNDIETAGGRPFYIRCQLAGSAVCEMADMIGRTFRIIAVLDVSKGLPELAVLDQAVDELKAVSALVETWRR